MKKKLWLGAVFGILCMLAGCGKAEKDGAAAASKEHVFRSETITVEGIEDANAINDLQVKDGRMYISVYDWKKEGGTELQLISQKLDGSERKTIKLEMGEGFSYSQLTPDQAGNYFAIFNHYYEDASKDAENPEWKDEYFLVKLDGEGKEVWKKPLLGEEENSYWVNELALLPDGRLLLSDSEGMALYDAEGNKTGNVKPQKEMDSPGVYQTGDGSIVLRYYDTEQNKEFLCKLDVDTGEVSQDYTIPGGASNFNSMYTGEGFDFFLSGSGSIYGYNLGDTQLKEIMNFIDSDLMNFYISYLAVVSDTEFYGVIDDENKETVLTRFVKVDPKDVKDKIVLTLACNDFDWDVRNRVVSFNKTNEEYRIKVEDYSQYNTEEDYSVGQTRLNTDIASGKVPDILVLREGMPVESYMSKGLFEDLYPYIDKDGEMAREDFFPNVLAAYEYDGKLYRLVPSFHIYTVSGKTAEVGTQPGWTLEELKQVMAAKPEGTQIFSEMTRDDLMRCGIQMSGDQFIDWKTGECSFDSEEFISLLEFAGEFPETLGPDYYGENFWENYASFWREGKVLLEMLYLTSFSNYNYDKKGTFGEDITLIGFPVKEGNGAALAGNLELAMSSKSKYKDGVWQFMRYFLTEEYQGKIDYQWPLSLKQTERLGQAAMKKSTYEDENGNMVEVDETYMINGVEIPITPMTREEVDGLVEYVKSVNQLYSYNEALINIVMEEAAPYFAGQKKAKEVAGIIQSRVQIYVNENR